VDRTRLRHPLRRLRLHRTAGQQRPRCDDGRVQGDSQVTFDRVLAAQAIVEGFGLVTDDRAMEVLGVERVWGEADATHPHRAPSVPDQIRRPPPGAGPHVG
jgi:hypothetical protein